MQDEIFHIPQAQEYCMGHVKSWDTKITTFPGVYVVSAVAHGLVEGIVSGGSRIFDDSTLCSSLFLRGVTLVLGWACIYVIHGIVCHNGLQKNNCSGQSSVPCFLCMLFLYICIIQTQRPHSLFFRRGCAFEKTIFTLWNLICMFYSHETDKCSVGSVLCRIRATSHGHREV